MGKVSKMLAFDFGASSGRAILGTFDGKKLTVEEIHRFSNDPVEIRGSLHWDILRLFYEIKQGILKCVNSGHGDLASIAVDTWGVDFGLLDEKGNLLGNPYHYRDKLTDGMMEEVFKLIPREEMYKKTGIQFMKLNTVFQLFALKHHDIPALREAKTMLLTPDLLNYFLTGIKSTEYSIASTTQLLEPGKREWSKEIIRRLELPEGIFTDIVPSGTIIGKLSPEIAKELRTAEIPVVATAGHDTQSAIASVPSTENDFVYISCGTWSLMGVEIGKPNLSDKSYEMAFTNEVGVEDKVSYMTNIMGLWLVQESKRQWDREGLNLSFRDLESMAWSAEAFKSFIDPDHDSFIAPGNMPERIAQFCRNTNQSAPEGKGDVVRCIMQSLAMKYRLTVEKLEEILGKKLPVIHMVGGGIKDEMLCQFTADATGREVIAGPVEATSIGNLMVQAIALGLIEGLQDARIAVKNSFPTKIYKPQDADLWSDKYEEFKRIIGA